MNNQNNQIQNVRIIQDDDYINAITRVDLSRIPQDVMNFMKILSNVKHNGEEINIPDKEFKVFNRRSNINIVEVKIPLPGKQVVDLFIQPDFLLTKDYQKFLKTTYMKYTVGFLISDDVAKDIVLEPQDIKDVDYYKTIATHIIIPNRESKVKIGNYFYKPRVIASDNEEFVNQQINKTTIFNIPNIYDKEVDMVKVDEQFRYIHDNTLDKIGYLNKQAPDLQTDLEDFDNVKKVQDNIITSDYITIEETTLACALRQYLLYKDMVDKPKNYMRKMMHIRLYNVKEGDEVILKINHLVYKTQDNVNIVMSKFFTYDTKWVLISRVLKLLLKFFYNKNIDFIFKALTQTGGFNDQDFTVESKQFITTLKHDEWLLKYILALLGQFVKELKDLQ